MCWHRDLGLLSLRSVRDTFLLFMLSSLQYFVIAACIDGDTNDFQKVKTILSSWDKLSRLGVPKGTDVQTPAMDQIDGAA